MRLFTCIDLPKAMRLKLTEIGHGLPRIRWLHEDQLHLTLVFIGEVKPALLAAIVEQLNQVEYPSFELQCRGFGTFRSKVLWLGIEPTPSLIRLEKSIRQRLSALPGIELDRRKYHPHITIARMDRFRPPKLEQFLRNNDSTQFSFEVRTFQLKSSQLSGKGARHHTEQVFHAADRQPFLGSNAETPVSGDKTDV